MNDTKREPRRFRHLLTKSQLETDIQTSLRRGWQADAYRQFCNQVLDPKFPCFFATEAQKGGRLKYTFADLTGCLSLDGFCDTVAEFVGYVKTLPSQEQLYEVLIAFFKTPDATLGEHHARAWGILQHMMDNDPQGWPAGVARDPEDPRWSFSFRSTPIFTNVSSGFHKQRLSRNLGADLVLVIQFRDGFDHLPGDPIKLREAIRARIDKFDACPRSPYLGTYGRPESREYQQYALPDSNDEAVAQCPLTAGRAEPPPESAERASLSIPAQRRAASE
jgi:FPC/CPF motif-containing protein YcgG